MTAGETDNGAGISERRASRLSSHDRFPFLLLTIVPLAVAVVASFQPVYFGPPPNRLLMLPGLAWGLLGLVVIWRARSPGVAAMAVIAFALPAVVAMLFAPAIVLILLNLG